MENINIGIIKSFLSKKLFDSLYNKKNVNESKEQFLNFIKTLNESPVLRVEYNLYNNIEKKSIDNDLLATRYIDQNMKLLEKYTMEEMMNERKKLTSIVVDESILDESLLNVYKSVNNLIVETKKDSIESNVDLIHESFTNVLDHVKKEKNIIKEEQEENKDLSFINEDVLNIAIKKFNEKYSGLNEEDITFIKTLVNSNKKEKTIIFESLKAETLTILNNMISESIEDRKNLVIENINKMKDDDTIVDNIIKLQELKKKLI